jgi:hypothetical protein
VQRRLRRHRKPASKLASKDIPGRWATRVMRCFGREFYFEHSVWKFFDPRVVPQLRASDDRFNLKRLRSNADVTRVAGSRRDGL